MTLIELVVAMVVLAVLAAAAAPGFSRMLLDMRRSTVLNQLSASLNLARSEAVTRGLPISVCRSANGTSCATSGDWGQGWIVFVNNDNDAPAVVDAGEVVLRALVVTNPQYSIKNNDTFYTDSVTFGPDGRAYRGTDGSNGSGSFIYCDRRGSVAARAIFVNNAGRPRLSRDTNGDDRDEDITGVNLVCP